MDDERLELQITGVVQGVGYRMWTRRTASALGLRGWVRNEPDRSVSAVAVGPRDRLEQLVAACHDGPPPAEVEDVVARYGPPRDVERFTDFDIR